MEDTYLLSIDGVIQPCVMTWEEIEESSQGDNEYLAVKVGQLKPGESHRFGGGAQPIFEITREAHDADCICRDCLVECGDIEDGAVECQNCGVIGGHSATCNRVTAFSQFSERNGLNV